MTECLLENNFSFNSSLVIPLLRGVDILLTVRSRFLQAAPITGPTSFCCYLQIQRLTGMFHMSGIQPFPVPQTKVISVGWWSRRKETSFNPGEHHAAGLRQLHWAQPQQIVFQAACISLCTARPWHGVQRPSMLWHCCRREKMKPLPQIKTWKLICTTRGLGLPSPPLAVRQYCIIGTRVLPKFRQKVHVTPFQVLAAEKYIRWTVLWGII